MKRKNQILLVIVVLLVNLLLDRATKVLAINYLQGKEALSFLYNTVVLEYAENRGAFLSMGSNWPDFIKYTVLLIIPIGGCLYGLYYCSFKQLDRKLIIVFVSIIGGGLGNLIDRLFNDFAVVDFLNFGIGSVRTGILNVADMSVTFGILFFLFLRIKKDKSNHQTDINNEIDSI